MAEHYFHITQEQAESHERLDIFLTHALPDAPSRTFVKKVIDQGYVKVDGQAVKAHHKIHTGERVVADIPDDILPVQNAVPEDIPLDVFYEDNYLIVVNKPVGMVVHPAAGHQCGTLVNALLHYSKSLSNVNTELRPGIVHRLDQETSGLIVIAKDNNTHKNLAKKFERREIKKQYVALVEGLVEFDEGKIDVPIGKHPRHHEKKAVSFHESARDALTFYRVLARGKNVSLVLMALKTGRMHQLRVHMKHLGHPILGDEKYGKKNTFPRLALHAKSLGFQHPRLRCWMEFVTPTPKEFLSRVRK